MKLKSFRILRYKSIADSGECALPPAFTVLIGKNESGKTAVLEALRDFDCEQTAISAEAVPVSGVYGQPELELTFEISAKELEAAVQETHVSLPEDVQALILEEGLKLRKTFDGHYRFNHPAYEAFSRETEPGGHGSEEERLVWRKQRLSEILQVFTLPDLTPGQDMGTLQASIDELRRIVRSRLHFIADQSQKVEAVEILHAMTNAVSPDPKPIPPRQNLIHAIVKRLPRFVYFSDFKDVLPFEISIDALKDNATVRDFARLAGLDLDAVMTTQDTQRRMNLLNRASAVITGAFFDNWRQDRIELIARPEGGKILFGVKEYNGTDVYKMEQRSRGFQWFLSFYLRLNRYAQDNIVLLIDEPGMNLHPMAQANILRVIAEKSAGSMQIMFSTHSPALIDPEALDQIRYVVKSKANGSRIFSSISDDVDDETLMPVAMSTGSSPEELHAQARREDQMRREAQLTRPAAGTVLASVEESPAPMATAEVPVDVSAPPQDANPGTEDVTVPPEKNAAAKPVSEDEEIEELERLQTRKSLFGFFGR